MILHIDDKCQLDFTIGEVAFSLKLGKQVKIVGVFRNTLSVRYLKWNEAILFNLNRLIRGEE